MLNLLYQEKGRWKICIFFAIQRNNLIRIFFLYPPPLLSSEKRYLYTNPFCDKDCSQKRSNQCDENEKDLKTGFFFLYQRLKPLIFHTEII